MLILSLALGALLLVTFLAYRRASSDSVRVSGELRKLQEDRAAFQASVSQQASESLEIQSRALNAQMSAFRTGELAAVQVLARKEYDLKFEEEKSRWRATERADAIQKSRAVNRGLVAEQLAPHMLGFAYNPKDCHFLGKPCDYVIFDGLDAGELKQIVLLEVKTGESGMNARERQVRNVVQDGSISYEIFRLDGAETAAGRRRTDRPHGTRTERRGLREHRSRLLGKTRAFRQPAQTRVLLSIRLWRNLCRLR